MTPNHINDYSNSGWYVYIQNDIDNIKEYISTCHRLSTQAIPTTYPPNVQGNTSRLYVARCLDVARLRQGTWLNGQIIDIFLYSVYRSMPATHTFLFSDVYVRLIGVRVQTDSNGRGRHVEDGYDSENIMRYMQSLSLNQLQRDIILPINISMTHWILGIISPSRERLYVIDSMASSSGHPRVEQNLLQFYNECYALHNEPAVPININNWIVINSVASLPTQFDAVNCGVFVAMTAYYYITESRLPTLADFSGSPTCMKSLRHFMAKTIRDAAQQNSINEVDILYEAQVRCLQSGRHASTLVPANQYVQDLRTS